MRSSFSGDGVILYSGMALLLRVSMRRMSKAIDTASVSSEQTDSSVPTNVSAFMSAATRSFSLTAPHDSRVRISAVLLAIYQNVAVMLERVSSLPSSARPANFAASLRCCTEKVTCLSTVAFSNDSRTRQCLHHSTVYLPPPFKGVTT
jgi:hypothetical protein